MFGWATITLGIGPHSSFVLFLSSFLWPLYGIGQAIIIIFILSYLILLYFCPVVSSFSSIFCFSFFPCLISAVADWMSNIL